MSPICLQLKPLGTSYFSSGGSVNCLEILASTSAPIVPALEHGYSMTKIRRRTRRSLQHIEESTGTCAETARLHLT